MHTSFINNRANLFSRALGERGSETRKQLREKGEKKKSEKERVEQRDRAEQTVDKGCWWLLHKICMLRASTFFFPPFFLSSPWSPHPSRIFFLFIRTSSILPPSRIHARVYAQQWRNQLAARLIYTVSRRVARHFRKTIKSAWHGWSGWAVENCNEIS